MSNTLNIGSKIATLRKEKNWSQGDLAKQIEASREIIESMNAMKICPPLK